MPALVLILWGVFLPTTPTGEAACGWVHRNLSALAKNDFLYTFLLGQLVTLLNSYAYFLDSLSQRRLFIFFLFRKGKIFLLFEAHSCTRLNK